MDQAGCTVAEWHASLRARSADKIASASACHTDDLAAFHDTPTQVVQPPLIDDVLCLQRGGAKRVHRLRNGQRASFEVERDSLTLLQRGQAVGWITEGPIDYVHLKLGPDLFDDMPVTLSGRSILRARLGGTVGFTDPLLASLMIEMLRVCTEGGESRLYYESLLAALVHRLVRRCDDEAASGGTAPAARGGLAEWRLRTVLEYLVAHQTEDVAFDTLVQISGLSRAHFFRAFRQSTGMTPGRYLERLRVDAARRAIDSREVPAEVAKMVGFASTAAMIRAFRRTLLITPEAYRRCVRG